MLCLVTGGHGFVGSHLVELLLERGDTVRCLHRRRTTPAFLRERGVEVVSGDVRDGAGLDAAVRGVDEVYHLAALTRSLTRRDMLRTNVGGTVRLLDAAARAGLAGRFVLCSSIAAVGPSRDGTPLDEHAPRRPVSTYGESKRLAEDALVEASERVPVTALRPPAVYGPRDKDFLGLFQSVARGLAPVMGDLDRRYSLVHAADLARAMVAAARSPRAAGRVYFAAHPTVRSQRELIAAVEAAVGRRARRVRVPDSLLRLIGRATDLGSQLTGTASVFGSERARDLCAEHWVCTPAALERDAGWRAEIDLTEGFAATAASYRASGQIAGVPAMSAPAADR